MEERKRYDPVNYDIFGRAQAAVENINFIPYGLEYELKTLDQFEEREPEWLIPGYIPKKQITLICGTGGTGKTSFWTSLAASVSAGSRTLFDGSEKEAENSFIIKHDPHSVMFFSGEDSIETVLKRKLRIQGADMKMIYAMDMSDSDFDKVLFNSDYLRKLIETNRPYLCIFDPLQNFIDKKIKMADRNAMRQTMRSLIEYAEEYGTTFIVIMHTNKQANVYGRQRMADSADLWDIARSVLMIGDADEVSGLKYISHEKSSYGIPGKTMLFLNNGGIPTFQNWTDKKDRDFVLEETRRRNDRQEKNQKDEIVNCIMSALAESPEGVFVKDLNEQLNDLGYSSRAVKEVKAGLKNANRITYNKKGYQGKLMIKKP